jgi:hypothetical protein
MKINWKYYIIIAMAIAMAIAIIILSFILNNKIKEIQNLKIERETLNQSISNNYLKLDSLLDISGFLKTQYKLEIHNKDSINKILQKHLKDVYFIFQNPILMPDDSIYSYIIQSITHNGIR